MAADAMARKAALETGLRILSTTAILAMPLMVSGDTQQPKNETLFRGITNRDAASIAKGNGINAKDPRANATMEQHILEPAKPSQFISTTKDFATASGFAGKGGTVVVIDGSKVPGKTDLSAGSFQIGVMANILAFRDSEVLVRNNIPQSALVGEVKIP